MSHFLQLTRSVIFRLIAFLGSIIILLTLPLILLLLSPIYIYRIFISTLAKYLRPDLGKIVTTRSMFSAVYDVYTKPSMTVVISVIVDGKLELKKLMNEFELKTANARYDNGELKYPEMRQHLYYWMGFIFWKWDEKFAMKNHFRLAPIENCDKSKADKLRSELVKNPFKSLQSPWELILTHDYKDPEVSEDAFPKTLVNIRFQHAICDGFSIMKVIFNATESYKELEKLKMIQEVPKDKSIKAYLEGLWKILKCPYDMLYMVLNTFDLRPWGLFPSGYSREFVCATSSKIPIKLIKEIKTGYSVGFTSVLIAALTAGTRKAFEEKRLRQKVPDIIYCAAALPMKGHPDKLRNFMTFGMIPLPVGEPDSKLRLLKCHKYLQDVKRSTAALGIFFVLPLVGGLFHWVVKIAANVLLGGITLSNFAGPQEKISLVGHEWLDISSIFGTPPGTQGVAFSLLTYVDGLRITALVDKAIFAEESEVKSLVNGIVEELDILSRDLI